MLNIFDLKGKVAVVTGATNGMGLAIARALGEAGADLIVSGRTKESAEAAATELRGQGLSAKGLALEVIDVASVVDFARQALAAFDRADVLVLNAAANSPTGSTLSQSVDDLHRAMAANVYSNMMLVNAMVPPMIERKDGSAIFMSSRGLALELGPHNINVNSINPGPIRTDFSRAFWEDPAKEKGITVQTPMGRIGEPSDVAGLAVLLASASGRFIHGQNISVDGGMTA